MFSSSFYKSWSDERFQNEELILFPFYKNDAFIIAGDLPPSTPCLRCLLKYNIPSFSNIPFFYCKAGYKFILSTLCYSPK